MERTKTQFGKRFIALTLSIVMMLAMLPFNAVSVFATDPILFTVNVNSGSSGISGAMIDYTVLAGATALGSGQVFTDATGSAVIDLTALGADVLGAGIQYSVTATGYQSYQTSQPVSVASNSSSVTLSPSTATVSVSLTGSATVTLNGQATTSLPVDLGDSVTVEVTPITESGSDGSRIASVSIPGQTVAPLAADQPFVYTINNVTQDTDIQVTSVQQYKLTVTPTNEGTIRIDNQEISEKSVDAGKEMIVSVVPEEGYRISGIFIDLNQPVVPNPFNFSMPFSINQNTVVTASFVPVYTVEVTKNENGSIEIKDGAETVSAPNGFVTVDAGKNLSIVAEAVEHYHVSKVEVYEDGLLKNTETFEANEQKTYSCNLDINKNMKFVVTFEPDKQAISVQCTENGQPTTNGTVTAPETVDYGGEAHFSFAPSNGYTVKSVTVNGNSVDLQKDLAGNDLLNQYTVNPVEGDLAVTVEFVEISKALAGDYSLDDANAVRKVETSASDIIVYPKNTSAVFSTEKSGIRLTYSDSTTAVGAGNPQIVAVSSSKTVTGIELYYRAEGEWQPEWHAVPLQKSIEIVIDTDAPALSAGVSETTTPTTRGYYNSDVLITVSATDDDAGIAKIEYWIVKGGVASEKQSLYEYEDGQEVIFEKECSFTVTAAENNADGVQVFVSVTDRAGNETVLEENNQDHPVIVLDINVTAPEITVSIDGEKPTYAQDGYYNAQRVATVTFTEDRATCFDANAAFNGIKVFKVKKDENNEDLKDETTGEYILESSSAIKVWAEGDSETSPVRTLEITFGANDDNDAHYIWSIEYSNKADLSDNEIAANGDFVYDFTVDKKSPKGEIHVGEITISEIASFLTFNIWKNSAVDVEATIDTQVEGTSPLCEILYYKAEGDETTALLSEEQLDAHFDAGEFTSEKITVGKDEVNEKCVVYARLADYAGNVRYLGTNGIIYDKVASLITLEPDRLADSNSYYNHDVWVGYRVKQENDSLVYSGIKSIDYKIEGIVTKEIKGIVTKQVVETETGNLYTYEAPGNPGDPDDKPEKHSSYEDLTKEIYVKANAEQQQGIRIDAKKFNYDEVVLTVYATDNAGNVYKEDGNEGKTLTLQIDSTEVTASIEFKGTPVKTVTETDNASTFDRGYYGKDSEGNTTRTATLTVTGRESTFDGEAAIAGFVVNKTTNETTNAAMFSFGKWSHDGNNHSIDIIFDVDANINEWKYSYTNKAGKSIAAKSSDGIPDESAPFQIKGSTPLKFTVDRTVPSVGQIEILEKTWDKLFTIITFGVFKDKPITVNAKGNDLVSPVSLSYYRPNTHAEMTTIEKYANNEAGLKDFLDGKSKNGSFVEYNPNTLYTGEKVTLFETDMEEQAVKDELFVVYLKVTDYAGNYIYVNSDGHVVDATESIISNMDIYELKADGTQEHPEYTANGKNVTVYNQDVTVDFDVEDIWPFSGIASISYKITKDGTETKEETTLYESDFENNTKDKYSFSELEAASKKSASILVNAEENNSCNVNVEIKAIDHAGNESTKVVPLDIDVTAPKIQVTFESDKNDNAANGPYYIARTATVVITERTHHFDPKAATDGIRITWQNAKDATPYSISSWSTQEDQSKAHDPDKATHTATITFGEGNFTFGISYADMAGNVTDEITVINNIAINQDSEHKYNKVSEETIKGSSYSESFAVDHTQPEGTVTANRNDGNPVTWQELIGTLEGGALRYGYWSKEAISISETHVDEVSGVQSVEYYNDIQTMNAAATPLVINGRELVRADNTTVSWTSFTDNVSVAPNKQFVTYLKITDNSGNIKYISTNGLIADNVQPHEENIAPQISINTGSSMGVIYNSDVTISYSVVDPLADTNDTGTYSGLKTVDYTIYNMGVPTQQGNLFTFGSNNQEPSQTDLQNAQRHAGTIVVNSQQNNSNDVRIEISAEDNAGNYSSDSISIMIDITPPSISVHYDNNNGDTTFADGSTDAFFNNDRIATVVVQERNFAPERVMMTLTNTDGYIPELIGWNTMLGGGNGDETTHTATIAYSADGDYMFDIACVDLANNMSTPTLYNGLAPQRFTVDKTLPVFNVSYDNNAAQNGNYYKAQRTATLTINEHNFETSRIQIALTATDNGVDSALPAVSGWSTDGNTHVATISYVNDSLYSFDIEYADKAGNQIVPFEEEKFYVDQTNPELAITGVEDKSANNGTVAPIITYSDTNFDANRVVVALAGVNNGTVNYRNAKADIPNGQTVTYADFEQVKKVDDIYTLSANLMDKAGNESAKAIVFSANRFGSVYDLTPVSKILNKYLQNEEDIIFTEVNVDTLERGTIKIVLTKNGTPHDLEKGKDYSILETGGNGQWSQYRYTVNKSLFADDGRYSLAIYSVDAAGNINENIDETKEAEISFGIDKTAPVIIPVDLEDGVQYAVENKTVTVEVKDNLVLSDVKIYLNGKEVEYTVENETYTFNIPEQTSPQNVRIVATDDAGNVYEQTISKFLVSTNVIARWYNNTPLFVGSLIGVGVLGVGGVTAGTLLKKKKKVRV